MRNTIRVQLRSNPLTDDPGDYSAVVTPQGHLKQDDIIEAIIEEGTELSRETLVDVVNRYNRFCAKFAVSGYDVDTGLVYLRPVLTGVFHDKVYDPTKDTLYVAANQSKTIREEIANTNVEITGEVPSPLSILNVVSVIEGMDPRTLKIGRNAVISGTYIRVEGDDPSVGVYLTSVDGSTSVKLPDDCIARNDPRTVMILVPADLAPGDYRLKIITQYTKGSGQQLLAPREATYHAPLTLVA